MVIISFIQPNLFDHYEHFKLGLQFVSFLSLLCTNVTAQMDYTKRKYIIKRGFKGLEVLNMEELNAEGFLKSSDDYHHYLGNSLLQMYVIFLPSWVEKM